jgi:hypothetical protein
MDREERQSDFWEKATNSGGIEGGPAQRKINLGKPLTLQEGRGSLRVSKSVP